jgi:tryprostatin B 6-hydroxylase
MVVSITHYASLLCGAISFPTYFVRGEHHMHIVLYMQLLLITVASATIGLSYLDEITIPSAAAEVACLSGWFLIGLYGVRLVHRLWFHPLRKFPGSPGARITSFWLSWRVSRGDTFRQIKNLHDQYGPFVRIGPNNLSISHPKAVQVVYGSDSKCTKAAWYDLTKPMVSLQTFREKKLHEERRRVWSAAFGNKALRGYEQRLRIYRNKLISHLVESNGEGVNVTKWFNLFSFDFMGDLAFGKSFDMLETNREHWAVKLLNNALEPLAYAFPVWFFRVLTAIPGITKDWWRFIDFCAKRMDARLKVRTIALKHLSLLNASRTRLMCQTLCRHSQLLTMAHFLRTRIGAF